MKLAEIDWETRRSVLISALHKFREQNPTRETGTKYFIWYKGQAYPPKHIRSIFENKPISAFSGGDGTNRLFYDLGFTVVKGIEQLDTYRDSAQTQCSPMQPIVTAFIGELEKLFKKTWAPLNSADISEYPGVYLLAYAKELADKPVEFRDIFYVGMSATSLRTRLRQFSDGIEDGGHRSGAKRFFVRWAGGTPFSHLKIENEFFVATLPLACEPSKGLRTPADLQTMGIVAALEYFALARIKEELGLEPPLNKK
jgi:hypothetical protein